MSEEENKELYALSFKKKTGFPLTPSEESRLQELKNKMAMNKAKTGAYN
jgi:hypothetical protein